MNADGIRAAEFDIERLRVEVDRLRAEREALRKQLAVTEAAYNGCSSERELLARDLRATEGVRDQSCAEVTRLVGRAMKAEAERDATAEEARALREALEAVLRDVWDKWYPADIFTGESGDEGAVAVVKVREMIRAALSRTPTAHAAIAEARRRVVEAVRDVRESLVHIVCGSAVLTALHTLDAAEKRASEGPQGA